MTKKNNNPDMKDYIYSLLPKQIEHLGETKEINRIQPKVSISVTTYQHANYIEDCLDSLLKQKTTFPFEILVGEDGSKDNTREICLKYAEQHPDKIRLFLRNRDESVIKEKHGNTLYLNPQLQKLQARGEYIAVCDGDDYWTDPLKLQKQVDFLDEHPDYGLVFTNFINYKQIDKQFTYETRNIPAEYNFEELYKQCLIIHSTICYRRDMLDDELLRIHLEKGFKMGDYPSYLYLCQKKKFHYLPDKTAVYRMLPVSATKGSHRRDLAFQLSKLKVRLFFLKKERKIDRKTKVLLGCKACYWYINYLFILTLNLVLNKRVYQFLRGTFVSIFKPKSAKIENNIDHS